MKSRAWTTPFTVNVVLRSPKQFNIRSDIHLSIGYLTQEVTQ